MLEYDNPISNLLEQFFEEDWTNEFARLKGSRSEMDKAAINNTNSFNTGYTDRDYINVDRFLTDLRPERLSNPKKFKSFPIDISITFVNPQTSDRVSFYVEIASVENVKIDVRTLQPKSPIFKDRKEGNRGYTEKRSTMKTNANRAREVIKGAVKRLQASGFVVDKLED